MGDAEVGKRRDVGCCGWGDTERSGSGGREDVLPYIEIEKSTLGRFGLLSGCNGIFSVTSMSKKCPKMLPQCRRPILKMFPQCRKGVI